VTLAERLRSLDESVLGPQSAVSQPRPAWVRYGAALPGPWFLLLYDVVTGAGPRWEIAAVVYGVVAVPWCVAAALWHRRHPTGRLERSALWAVALLFVIGTSIVTAGALAPNRTDGGGPSYARGCHPAPASLVGQLRSYVRGDYRLDRVVTYGSAHAAVAAALVSGSMVIGGATFPVDHEVALWQVRPRPIFALNGLAQEISPSRQPGVVGAPFGTGDDEARQDRLGAQECVTR
jgi:hypothetical protein